MDENRQVFQADKNTWADATDGNFIKIENNGIPKLLGITNWRFEEVPKFDKPTELEIAFICDVYEEDNRILKQTKLWTVRSKKLKQKLRPVLESLSPQSRIKISVTVIGERFDIQYAVNKVD